MIHEEAEVHPSATVADSALVWAHSQIREQATIGDDCIIGRGVYIGVGVEVGANSKIQNGAQVYEPAVVGMGAFIGPGAILTNDREPRAIRPDGALKSKSDWEAVGVTVDEGASIGAGAICVAPVRVGSWAMIAAGAVVTQDVPAHALVAGVPARSIGWVGRSGQRLQNSDRNGHWRCPRTGEVYRECESGLELTEDSW